MFKVGNKTYIVNTLKSTSKDTNQHYLTHLRTMFPSYRNQPIFWPAEINCVLSIGWEH